MRQLSPDDSSIETSGRIIQQDFEILYKNYQEPIERYLMNLVHDRELALDLCQETFTRVLRDLLSKETISQQTDYHVKNWLYKIARNIAIDNHRHKKSIDFLPMPESEAYTQFGELMVEGDEDRICDLLWLQEAVAQMPPKYRECLLAKHYWGYTQKEIALKLGISESAVSANVSRGKTQLHGKYFPVTADLRQMEAEKNLRRHCLNAIAIFDRRLLDLRYTGHCHYTGEQLRVMDSLQLFRVVFERHRDLSSARG